MRKLLYILSLSCTTAIAAPLDAMLKTEAPNIAALKNMRVNVTTLHRAMVKNNTDQVQNITIYYKICAKSCDTSHHYNIKIQPHGIWEDGITLHLNPIYAQAGRYSISGETRVIGTGLDQAYPASGYVDVR